MLLTRDKSFYKQFFSLYWVLVLHNVIILGVNLYAQQLLALASCTATVLLIVYMRTVIAPLNKLKDKK